MKTAVIVFPGTNRERDMAIALEKASGQTPKMIWHGETALPDGLDLVVLPGGFSYGDYLRCGAMAAHSPVMQAVKLYAEKGGRILGVCNGFQMLAETQLVPGTLMRNASLKFICKQVALKIETNDNGFFKYYNPGEIVTYPVAHGEGNWFADDETLAEVEGEGLVALRYVDNINGSRNDIAGVFNKDKTILGMMPHPEDAVDPMHGGTDGLRLFQAVLEDFL